MKFELLPHAAKHHHRTPNKDGGYTSVMVNPGEVIESDDDLTIRFPNKFRLYGEVETKHPVNKKRKTTAPDSTSDQSDNADAEDDVTASFSEASGTGLRVLKKGSKFLVVDSDGESVTDGPVSRGAAGAAIANYVDASAEG